MACLTRKGHEIRYKEVKQVEKAYLNVALALIPREVCSSEVLRVTHLQASE
jgi:hypothetical protein